MHIYAVYKTLISDLVARADWKQGNGNEKKAGVAILTSDKTDFKIKTAARNKDTE